MKNILLLGVLMLVTFTQAQISILSQKKIGSNKDDFLKFSITSDSLSYIFVGESDSDALFDKSEACKGGSDIWIVKTDLNFNILWDKTIGGSSTDIFNSFLLTDSVIYCLISSYSSNSGDFTFTNYGFNDLVLFKLDYNGNLLAQQNYGGSGSEGYGTLLQKNDKLVIVSSSSSDISGNKTEVNLGGSDFWILEIEPSNFSIINQKVIGTNQQEDYTYGVINDLNELYIACSNVSPINIDKSCNGYGYSDIWVLKLDSSFNVINDNCYGGVDNEIYPRLCVKGNDIFLLSRSHSGASGNKTSPYQGTFDGFSRPDAWLVKLDSNLNILWDKTFGGTNDEFVSSIQIINENLISLNCISSSIQNSGNKTSPLYGASDAWIVFVDTNGNKLGEYSFGGTNNETIGSVLLKNDTLVFAGQTNSPISGNQNVGTNGLNDVWLMKLKLSGLGLEKESEQSNNIDVYPNPFSKQVTFSLKSAKYETSKIELFSADGRKIDEIEINQATNQAVWNPKCENGIYYYSCGNINGKIMYVK
ncbi:MAG TPA: T9SS type A sorting domain-containing protein [Fluviicola sp.]|nr:T9SS type A sorting domain-containing protein [Fluviicola sp.]